MRVESDNGGVTVRAESEQETTALAAQLAPSLRPGTIVFLTGPLGSGKSVFARALIRALAADPAMDVPSPTFTLVQTYDTPAGLVWHYDLYRIENSDEIYELGWEDAQSGGIVIVEWPDRLGPHAPENPVIVSMSCVPGSPQTRLIEFAPAPAKIIHNFKK